jgi:hypothetical protein
MTDAVVFTDTLSTNLSDNNARKIGIRAKIFSPLRTKRMMVCRGGELHNDDIVGAGFASPYHRCRPHHRPNGELHNGDMVVGAKNFSPPRRLGCDDTRQMDCFAALAMTDSPEIVVRVNTSVFTLFSYGTKRIFTKTF